MSEEFIFDFQNGFLYINKEVTAILKLFFCFFIEQTKYYCHKRNLNVISFVFQSFSCIGFMLKVMLLHIFKTFL